MNPFLNSLAPITNPLNSFLLEKEYDDVDKNFKKISEIAKNLPRTTVIRSESNYWKGVCRSLIFRFPDDLEILMIKNNPEAEVSSGIIQIRSASRIGQSDLGVNYRRIINLISRLDELR